MSSRPKRQQCGKGGRSNAMSAIAIARISERQARRAPGAHAAPFIAPALAVLCAINVLPLLWSIGVSFFHFRADRLNTPPRFLGFDNYVELMTDPDIWEHFVNTGAMIAVSVSTQLVVGALLAFLFQRRFPGRRL